MNRRVRDVTRLARRYGRTLSHTRNGHLRLEHPHLDPIITPGSPSDWRSIRKLRANLERAHRH